MTREELQQTIQALIADGKTKEVFSFLKKQDLPAQQSSTVTLIEAEFNELQKSSLKGIISFQEERLQKIKSTISCCLFFMWKVRLTLLLINPLTYPDF